jgi:protein involved in temperature-dependent protein secretion
MSETLETAQKLLTQGDLKESAALLQSAFAQTSDGADGLLLLFVQFSLADFAGAKATLDRLVALFPHLNPLLSTLAPCGAADWQRHARLSRPDMAGQRRTFGALQPWALLYAQACTQHAEGKPAEAKVLLQRAASSRPRTPGMLRTTGGQEFPFADLYDSDDLTGPSLPVYHEGNIYDLYYADLKRVTFLPRSDPFHGLFPWLEFETKGGARGKVRFPALYTSSGASSDPMTRIGRLTQFDHSRGYCVAVGLRDLWVVQTDGTKTLMGLGHLASMTF